jgi:hypothetical protein
MPGRCVREDSKSILMMGMTLLLLFNLWPRYLPVTGGLSVDGVDFVRGVLIGGAIALNLWYVRLSARDRRRQYE